MLSNLLIATALAATPPPSPELRAVASDDGRVEASSARRDARAAQVWDGIAWRAWISASADSSPRLRYELTSTRYLQALRVQSGDQRNGASWKAHARPARLRVRWDGGETTFALADTRKPQTLRLPRLARTATLTIEVVGTYGRAAGGVAIGEIALLEPTDVLSTRPELRQAIEHDVEGLVGPGSATAQRRLVEHGRPAVPWLVDASRSADPARRAAAVTVLAQISPVAAREVLLTLLQRPEHHAGRARAPYVRTALATLDARPELMDDALHAALAERLTAGEPDVRVGAARLICARGDRRAVAPIVELLAARAPEAVEAAPACLPRFPGDAIRACRKLIAHADPLVRATALATLGQLPDEPKAVSLVLKASRAAEPTTRRWAIAALGELGGARAHARLREMIDPRARRDSQAAARAMAHLPELDLAEMEPLLMRADLDAATPLLRRLARTDSDEARAVLIDAVTHGTFMSWQRLAADSLLTHGQPGLRAMLRHLTRQPLDARGAASYLQRAACLDADGIASALDDSGRAHALDPYRAALVDALAATGDTRWTARIAAIATRRGNSTSLRARALRALGRLGGDEATAAVMAAVEEQDPNLVDAAAGAIADLRLVAGAWRLLERLSTTPAREWRYAWIRPLDVAAITNADTVMSTLGLGYPLASVQVRKNILEVAHRIGSRRALSLLVQAATDREPSLRSYALALLQRDQIPRRPPTAAAGHGSRHGACRIEVVQR